MKDPNHVIFGHISLATERDLDSLNVHRFSTKQIIPLSHSLFLLDIPMPADKVFAGVWYMSFGVKHLLYLDV